MDTEIVSLQGKKIKLIKLKDNVFNGNHPNGIVEGTVREGEAMSDLVIGRSFLMLHNTDKLHSRAFVTTTVVSITDNTFNTINSTYTFEVL